MIGVMSAIAMTGLTGLNLHQREPVDLLRWSNDQVVRADSVDPNEQGLRVRHDGSAGDLQIPWYDLRSIPQSLGLDSKWETIHARAWKSHQRAVRADYPGAQVFMKSLDEMFSWNIGVQSVDHAIISALIHIDRLEFEQAWVSNMKLDFASQSGAKVSADFHDRYDSKYNVFVDLPPIFDAFQMGSDQVEKLIGRKSIGNNAHRFVFDQDVLRLNADPDSIDDLRGFLTKMIRDSHKSDDDLGLELMLEMILAIHHPESNRRIGAREKLSRRSRVHTGTWIESWARLGVGVSLLNEIDTNQRELGLIECIHIIVRLKEQSRTIAILASEFACDYLEQTHRSGWADQLRESVMNVQPTQWKNDKRVSESSGKSYD